MILLIPLTIFLIACVAMVIIFYRTKEPGSIDTVEAYCDAILRSDQKVLNDLLIANAKVVDILNVLKPLSSAHREVGVKYNLKVGKTLETPDTTIELVEFNDPSIEKKIIFTCQHYANQWLITRIKEESSAIE